MGRNGENPRKSVKGNRPFADSNADEQAIIHYMYNSGEKMTTAKAVELTGRSRRYIGKVLRGLSEIGVLKWYGSSKNDKNQYYMLDLI